MKDKLERIIIKQDAICDYCDKIIPAGSVVFVRYDYQEGSYHYYWCSQHCLDSYEAEEFISDLEFTQKLSEGDLDFLDDEISQH